MTYTESIVFLFKLQKFGMKFGLQGIEGLLHFLGHPEKQFPTIHIAGTNGKGSTASMIAAVFTSAGYKTGLFTSPHVVSFNERIRINGKPISVHNVSRLASLIKPEVERNNLTFFEAVTAMAFKYFEESKVDIAVIETGLGGRLDATNVIKPLVSVITSIGLEHTQILGKRISDITFEKGGIIKEGIPCVTGVKSAAATRILKKICFQKNTHLVEVRPENRLKEYSLDGFISDFSFAGKKLKNLFVSLTGDHQFINASVALKAIETATEAGDFKINEKSIRRGLGNITKYSGLQARLSIIRRKPLVLADVGHNPEAINYLCTSIKRLKLGKFHVVIGLMYDKDYKKIFKHIGTVADKVFIVEATTERSRPAADLARAARKLNMRVEEFTNVISGFKRALSLQDGIPVLITGSHFVVGEALAYLRKEKYLTINQ